MNADCQSTILAVLSARGLSPTRRFKKKKKSNSERGVPEGSGEMQEEAQRTHRREKMCSYHAPIGVSDSLYLSL